MLVFLSLLCLIIFFLSVSKKLRFKLISLPFLHWFRRENPPLSIAEQEVINAGGVWWGDQIFKGEPDWCEFLSAETASLTQKEQDFLNHQVSTFCNLLEEWKISYQDYDLSPDAWNYIKENKFLGLEIDPQYGGLGFSPFAHSAIINKIATCSVSAAISVMVPNSLGPGAFIKYYGTEEQKNYYLPRLASGEEIPCFALTGVEAGSDAANISDIGVLEYGFYSGKKLLGIRLNWNKRYITMAPMATLIGLAFRLNDPDRLLGTQVDLGITLALVPVDLPGIEKRTRHFPLNIGFMNGPVRGKDVFIPLDFVIGGKERCGQGWQMMLECLVVGRGISLPSLATGVIQSCWLLSTAYATVRQQFNRSIIKFEGIQQKLAHMGGIAYLAEATRRCTVESIHFGGHPAVPSALSKYHLTELARLIVADGMDIHAGQAIQLGPQNYMSVLHNVAPIMITVEGANILTRGLIIYGQGLMRCHPYLQQELQAAMAMDVNSFDKIFFQHVGFFLVQFFKLIVYGFTCGCCILKKIPEFEKKYFRQLTRMSNAFAVVTDIILLVLGKKLKIKEALSARMGDILSHIYMAAAVLRYFHQNHQDKKERDFKDWAIIYCFRQIQNAWMDFFANFPVRWLAKLLKFLIFPWGLTYFGSTDKVGTAIAFSLQQDHELYRRIIPYCYFSPGSAAWKMEQAMAQLNEVAPLLEKIQKLKDNGEYPLANESRLSMKIRLAYQQQLLQISERDQLQAVADLCWEVIQSDEFSDLRKTL